MASGSVFKRLAILTLSAILLVTILYLPRARRDLSETGQLAGDTVATSWSHTSSCEYMREHG